MVGIPCKICIDSVKKILGYGGMTVKIVYDRSARRDYVRDVRLGCFAQR